MCGICGIVDSSGAPVDAEALDAMSATLVHRGPDGSGSVADGPAGLAHRRLAVVDPEGGHQPMVRPDAGLWLVANCEIYNHRELRATLEGLGHRFRTRCDAEVILEGYARWGDGVVERLSGFFAFAIWDRAARRLLLARDRFGQKPLCYTQRDGRFLFASEVRALLAALPSRPPVDPAALAQFLQLDFVTAPHSLWSGVRRLLPGTCLALEDGRVRTWAYWSPRLEPKGRLSAAEAGQELSRLFDRAVDARLMADVPLGVLLSGGLDSSLVAERVSRSAGREPLHTFSAGFDDPEFDESAAAQGVAQALGTTHHRLVLTPERFLALQDRFAELLDEPLADPSLVATHAVCALAREHVTVVLGGDGADELFSGYDTVLADRVDAWTRWLGPLRPPALSALVRLIPSRAGHFDPGFRLRHLRRGLRSAPETRPLAWLLNLDGGELLALRPEARDSNPLGAVDEAVDAPPDADPRDRALRLFLRTYLEADILPKLDRASMACSLELRSPFLDPALAEFALRLPHALKVRGLERKWLLRRALGPRLPPWVSRRPKHGFSLPLSRWMNGPLADWFDALLLDPASYTSGLVRRDAVERMLRAHRQGRINYRKPLWNLAVLFLWQRRWAP